MAKKPVVYASAKLAQAMNERTGPSSLLKVELSPDGDVPLFLKKLRQIQDRSKKSQIQFR